MYTICINANSWQPQQSRSQGVTLVELVIAISIGAILLTMAVPAFQGLVTRNRVTAYTNAFLGYLSYARSEAAMRGRRVVVCKSSDSANCTTANGWEQGWIVFVDVDSDATVDTGTDTVLRVHGEIRGGITIRGNTNVANFISYSSDGRARNISSTGGTLSLCAPGTDSSTDALLAANAGKMNAISVNLVGRAGVVRTLTTANVICP